MIEIYLALFATITHAATITRRAVIPRAESTSLPPELIGYVISQDSTETWNCRESSAWQTVGTVGKCCMTDGSDCFMATTCISGSIMANGQARSTCTGTAAQTSCVTGTVFRSIGDQTPIMNYQCWPEWNDGNWAATRVTTTPSPTSSSASSTSSAASSSPTTSLPAETSGAAESNDGEKKEKSKAWIAGPVIGSVVGALFFTHFGIWLYRRRLSANQNPLGAIEKDTMPLGMAAGSPGVAGDSVRYAHMGNGGVGVGGVAKESPTQELPNREVHELGGVSKSGSPVVEADGNPVDRK